MQGFETLGFHDRDIIAVSLLSARGVMSLIIDSHWRENEIFENRMFSLFLQSPNMG